ncbi:DNA adenine methylase [Dyella nitratireducens]|uniref:site-specific DNA-methyltransferase (adenine-specific) n=1 Tax=Dyella nitratireducens TaxID=1849580 RepID=A0ABQ1GM67_9GAMM|nr:DNA adenine methylase [Dyella nitratireducens]GGA46566.1 DNA methyltransferase [Dyella nitratireducens]GLQ41466.1 DNA methyltransferase [Dyella nitratireducens]
MPINHSPLRYPGGKAALAPFLKALIQENGLGTVSYAEPYCGGSGAALELLFEGIVDAVYLNDIDPAIYSFWRTIVRDPEAFCSLIASTPITIDEWHVQREYYLRYRTRVGPKLAFAAFYLNRTNRSGILAAGPIGGRAQTGKWLLGARFNKEELIKKIKRIARYADRIHVSQLDAIEFLKDTINPLKKQILVYLDPPYYVQGQSLYTNHYGPDDHAAIAKFVQKKLNKPWVVSYDNHPKIEQLYGTCERVDYGIRYSAQARYFGRELIVISDKLQMTDITDPLSVDRLQSQQRKRENDVSRRAMWRQAGHA